MNEIWKPVVGYEGLYEVSNLGRVKSLPKVLPRGGIIPERIKAIQKLKTGYLEVTLFKNGNPKHLLVHRLVAIAFIERLRDKNTVNHIDEDKENNNSNNLEWVTQAENNIHGTRINRAAHSCHKTVVSRNKNK